MKIVTKINHKPGKEALMKHTPNHVFYIKIIPVSETFSAISVKTSELCHSCKQQLHIWWVTAAV